MVEDQSKAQDLAPRLLGGSAVQEELGLDMTPIYLAGFPGTVSEGGKA